MRTTPNRADLQHPALSTRELALALGVSQSSVKRWVDDGTLEAERTAGGHRRISLEAAMRFIRKTGTPVAAPELLTGTTTAPALAELSPRMPEVPTEALWSALSADDPAAVRDILLTLFMAHWSLAAICDGPVRSVMTRIGELWQHDPGGIFIEHRATDTCLLALAELRAMVPEPAAEAAVALGGAPAGDPYALPSLIASLVLAEQGFRERNLGPNTPASALIAAAEHYRPRLLWLASSSEPRNPRELSRDLHTLTSAIAGWKCDVVLGGRGLPPLGRLPENVHRFESMSELAAFAQGLKA